MIRNISIIITLIFITSCIKQVEKRGYSFELSDYKLAQEGLSSKSTIIDLMGSPTFKSDIDGKELWVYYSEDVRKLLFLKRKILKRQIITVSFDETGISNKINTYSLKDRKNIKFIDKYTKVEPINKGFWSRIFGNIGQVSAN